MIKTQINSQCSDHIVLHFEGQFDRNTAHKVRKDSLRLADMAGPQQLEIDLTNAKCLDTSCLAVMVEIWKAVHSRGGKLKLTGVDEGTAKMISLSHLDDIFESVSVAEKK